MIHQTAGNLSHFSATSASKYLLAVENGSEEIGGDNFSRSRRSLGLRIRAARFVGVRRATGDTTLGARIMSISTPIIPFLSSPSPAAFDRHK